MVLGVGVNRVWMRGASQEQETLRAFCRESWRNEAKQTERGCKIGEEKKKGIREEGDATTRELMR